MNLYRIGANSPFSVTQYKDLAKSKVNKVPENHVVVSVTKDGAKSKAEGFTSRDAANTRYDQIATRPGDVVYVTVFDKTEKTGEPYDEGYFVATTVQCRTTQSAAGWIAAGIAGIFGLMAFGGKKGRR